MLYLFIALIASIIGALSGLGGGVIIKPILDAIGHYDITTINLLSSFTVLSMAVASTMRHYQAKTVFDQSMTPLLVIGSIIGAMLGDSLFTKAIEYASYPQQVKQLQNVLLLALLAIVLLYINYFNKKYQFHIKNRAFILLIGLSLGFISTLLGIGGGPINIMALTLFFALPAKDASINSLILILFSQASKIFNVFLNHDLLSYDLSMLLYMIPGGIIGGLLGSKLHHRLSSRTVKIAFNLVLFFTMLTTLYNIYLS